MELEVQKHPVATVFQRPDDLRPFCVIQLHPDFQKWAFIAEAIQKMQCFVSGSKIAGNNDISILHELLL